MIENSLYCFREIIQCVFQDIAKVYQYLGNLFLNIPFLRLVWHI